MDNPESYDLDRYQEDLTLLLHAWPDIEEAFIAEAERGSIGGDYESLVDALRQAFRVEVYTDPGVFDAELGYVLLFDVNSYTARQAAATTNASTYLIDTMVSKRAPIQSMRRSAQVLIVPSGKPVAGEVCPRVLAAPPDLADLRDLPEPEPPQTSVPLISRGVHKLTPIEAPFYDALQETDLVFAVQPRVQGDRTYRPDFIVFYGGKAVVVELDGHEGHKTKEQRVADAKRELWFQQKGLSVLRWTGTQVTENARACVDQLLLVLRGSQQRP